MAYETEYTDFDSQEDSSACLTLGLATDIVESRYLRDFSTAEPEEKQQILKDLTTFLEQLLRQPQISGSADAWHNLCVDLARIDAYDLACLVLQRGLDFYPKTSICWPTICNTAWSAVRENAAKPFAKHLTRCPRLYGHGAGTAF